jgi:hypothetical protein
LRRRSRLESGHEECKRHAPLIAATYPEGQAVRKQSRYNGRCKTAHTILRINTWEILKFSQESGEEVLHYFINVRPRKDIQRFSGISKNVKGVIDFKLIDLFN